MGLLVDGVWQDKWYGTKSTGGRFVRNDAVFRNWITAGGSAGPSGEAGFKAEPGRYHLYVSLACPWAHEPPADQPGAHRAARAGAKP